MNERPTSFAATSERPALPIPVRDRWQPLRFGLVEMFQYDSEEFWFRDGHLLLRGNNGTGKSKVLSLTLQQFTATGLLAAAIPQVVLPDIGGPWTIDPALGLARRAEQALSTLDDKDEAWARVQKQISEELTELQTALSALGHRAQAEQNDWGLIAHVIYQNRPERPDMLAARLAEEMQLHGLSIAEEAVAAPLLKDLKSAK
jgi:hypothetical protein